MNIAEVQDIVEKYVLHREGVPKSITQIQHEMKQFIQARDNRRYEGRNNKRGLNSNPNRKFDYVREGYSIRKIPRRDLEQNS